MQRLYRDRGLCQKEGYALASPLFFGYGAAINIFESIAGSSSADLLLRLIILDISSSERIVLIWAHASCLLRMFSFSFSLSWSRANGTSRHL